VLKLYDAARCPYCARVRIVLAEKNVEHELFPIDLSDRPPWLYDKNQTGRVPVLEDGSFVLPESAVVNEYVEERYPQPAMLPSDPDERAKARLFIFRFDEFGGPYYALRRGEEDARKRLDRALGRLDAVLERQEFLTGSGFGLADAAYLPWVIRAQANLAVDVEPFGALTGWLERTRTRPSVAAELELVAAAV
jgi:RNA polymerase-associated protein